MSTNADFGERVRWHPEKPRWTFGRLLVFWLTVALAVLLASALVPGFDVGSFGNALSVALLLSLFNAVVSPLLAAARLPLPLVSGFLLMLFANAYLLLIAEEIVGGTERAKSLSAALVASLVIAATAVVLEVLFGVNDDSTFDARVIHRVARRQGVIERTDVPGIVFLEIDGLALPVLQRAMSDGSAPNMAAWLADGSHSLLEWETDLSSQTGASQAGILLGSNADIPAFRWVEKESGRVRACSAPADCEAIESERATGRGLLVNGGTSRGNLLSGEADEAILTVSRMAAEVRPNPGYRTFFSNAYNVTRSLVLFLYEVLLEWTAALRARRRNVRPRGHRGGFYPFMRAAMCVVVRDLIVFGVMSDMLRGKPAVYATFSSYDEVAHHSGLQRPDTLEALRKVDQAFGRIARARRFAPRPYAIVVLSDHGQTQGATFLQRNGFSLEELVRTSLQTETAVVGGGSGDETQSMVGHALDEATGRGARKADKAKQRGRDVSDEAAVVLGSGNLGLVYLMEERRRLTMEEIDERHPRLLPALRSHPHIGWLLVRSRAHGPVALGADGAHYLAEGRIEGEDPLAAFSPNAPRHLLRTDGFGNVADVMVGSFYDPMLDEGCAFEELISFHGGLGGPQTRPFVLHPVELPAPREQIVGAEAVHGLLQGWRAGLQGDAAVAPPPPAVAVEEGAPVRRPRGVTAVAILVLLQALASLALGVGLIVGRNDASIQADVPGGTWVAVAAGIGLVVFALAQAVVARSLWVGRRWARLVVAGLELVDVLLGVQVTLTQTGSGFWNGLVKMALALLVIALLYAGRSDEYFAGAASTRKPSGP
jgi:uncharacterized membrane protein YvlD (DUF360 family)